MSLIADFLLIWTVWINVGLQTLEDAARRKEKQRTFSEVMNEASVAECLMLIPMCAWIVYVAMTWLNIVGTLGQSELMFYQWLLDAKAVVTI